MIGYAIGRIRWLVRGRSSTAAVLQTAAVQAGTIVANTATGILVARLLAPTGRGEVAAITLLPVILGFILAFGIPSALMYNLKRHAADSRQLIGAALLAASVLGIVGVAVGYVIAPWVLHQYSPHVVGLARIFLLWIPLTLYMYVCGAAFDARGEFWNSNSKTLLTPVLTFVLLCVLALFRRLDPLTASLSYALPSVFTSFRLLVELVSRYKPVFVAIDVIHYRRLASYGIRSFGIDLLKTIGQQVDTLLVIAFLSPASMGLYAVSLAISRILQLVQSSFSRVLLPRVAARPSEEVLASVGRAVRITIAITSVACVGLVVFAPFVLHLAYGNKFVAATPVLRVLAIEALFAGATWILAQAFMALGKPGIVSMLQGIGLALSVPLMIVLIPRLGLVGAALSLLISTLTRFGVVLACFPWLLNKRPPGLVISRSDIVSLRKRFGGSRTAGHEPAA